MILKVKGKRIDNGEWIVGDGIHYPKSINYIGTCWIDGGLPVANDWVQVIPETVCLFTGLHDINGNEIYENDIVRYKNIGKISVDWDTGKVTNYEEECIRTGLVEFTGGCFTPLPEIHDCEDYWYSWANINFEVLGNKFDNPELLK